MSGFTGNKEVTAVDTSTFDALLPPQVAARAEDIGTAKGGLDAWSTFLLAVLAGEFIAMGAMFSSVAVTGAADVVPFGLQRVVAGVTFCLGLVLVVVAGAELFTGNNLLIMAFVSGKLPIGRLLRNWMIVYLGNLVGATATAWLIVKTGQHEMGNSAVGTTAVAVANAKCRLDFTEALVRGIYCNALVCLAVWLCFSCRSTGDKILAIIFPISAFVAGGFEHCVANMYFIPLGLLLKSAMEAGRWVPVGALGDVQAAVPDDLTALSWRSFLVANLIPVTIGNVIGGSGFVGLIYWVIYGRRQQPVRGD